MNTTPTNKTRPAAPKRRPVLARALQALPWALAAVFFAHLVMARGMHLYARDALLDRALEIGLAAAVLMWVWRALARLEDLPAGHTGAPVGDDDPVYADSGFWGTKQSPWDDDLPPGYPMVFDRTGMTVESDREAIL